MPKPSGSIGEYIVTGKIGSGSFATVYKGHHKTTLFPVAIKAIARKKLNPKLLENLEAEIAIMRTIDHPNIVRLYEIKKTDKHIYLVLEYCAGGDLQKFIKKAPTSRLQEQVAHHFVQELAKGMAILYHKQLIHRDLKPQNLLLTEESPTATLKIADFGFARHLEATSMAETLCGSPLFMAPEILRFQKYDAKADLWSIGTILYEMLVGKPPFNGANHVQLLANIERHELRFPENLEITTACLELLRGLLRRNPEQRIRFEQFFTAEFVQIDSEQAAALHGSAATPTSFNDVSSSEPEIPRSTGTLATAPSLTSSSSTASSMLPFTRRNSERNTYDFPERLHSPVIKGSSKHMSDPRLLPAPISAPIPRTNPFKTMDETLPTTLKPPLSRTPQTTTSRRNSRNPRMKAHSTNGTESTDEYVLVEDDRPMTHLVEETKVPPTMSLVDTPEEALSQVETLGKTAQAIAQVGDSVFGATSMSASTCVSMSAEDSKHEKPACSYVDALALYMRALEMFENAIFHTRRVLQAQATGIPASPVQENVQRQLLQTGLQGQAQVHRQLTVHGYFQTILNWLLDQFRITLEHTEQCRERISRCGCSYCVWHDPSLAKFREESDQPSEYDALTRGNLRIYQAALDFGGEGTVQEVLGQTEHSQRLYVKARLLFESLLMKSTKASTRLSGEDQEVLVQYIQRLNDRVAPSIRAEV